MRPNKRKEPYKAPEPTIPGVTAAACAPFATPGIAWPGFNVRRNMRLSLPCALFLLAVSVSRAESPPMTFFEGPSKCALKFEATSEGKAFVSVVVQGERHMLFLDTGATTILDLRIARRLGLNLIESPDVGTGLTGVVGTRWLGRVDLRIGEMKITSFPVSCLDLSALRVLHQKSGLPELDGLIGSDLLVILRAQIDYDSRKLTIKRPTRIP